VTLPKPSRLYKDGDDWKSNESFDRTLDACAERDLEMLNGLVEQRHHLLHAKALELGTRFYAEELSIFCKRLAGYWRACRRKQPHFARPAEAAP
jgi:hypothetical protein